MGKGGPEEKKKKQTSEERGRMERRWAVKDEKTRRKNRFTGSKGGGKGKNGV